jgi:hypothetical protein
MEVCSFSNFLQYKNRLKVPQMPSNLSAQIVCQSSKVWYFDEKRLY